MDEFDPFLSFNPTDKLTPAEYLAREEALTALIHEAVEQHDALRKGDYEDALADLAFENPGKGAYHSVSECPEATTETQRSSRRLFRGLGLGRDRSTDLSKTGEPGFSCWWFPELQGPDLSVEVIPGQHDALSLLNTYTIAEIFSEEPNE